MLDMLNPDLARVMLAQLLASPDAQANIANTILGYLRNRLGVLDWRIDYLPAHGALVLDGGNAGELVRFLMERLCAELAGDAPAINYHATGDQPGEFRAVAP